MGVMLNMYYVYPHDHWTRSNNGAGRNRLYSVLNNPVEIIKITQCIFIFIGRTAG